MGDPRHVTRANISLPRELMARLRRAEHFNWSAVARVALEQALDGNYVGSRVLELEAEVARLREKIRRVAEVVAE